MGSGSDWMKIGAGAAFPTSVGSTLGAQEASGGGKSGPAAPDFTAAANAQTQANRPDQTNAYGSTSQWTQGGDGKWSQNSSFGGPLAGAASGLEGQFADAWKNPLDNGAQARQHAEDAIYGRETSRLDPRFQQQEQQFNTQMANQGLAPGMEAYNNARGNFDRGKNDAYQQAQYGAIMGGGQEGQRQQQMDLTGRMAPLGALEGMGGLGGQQGFSQASQLLPAAIAQYQGALQSYGIQQQGKNSTMGGLADLGSIAMKAAPAAAAASDGRLKESIVATGRDVLPGVPEVTFRYRGEPTTYRGVLAQDVERAGYHEKVRYRPDGYMEVLGEELMPVKVGG